MKKQSLVVKVLLCLVMAAALILTACTVTPDPTPTPTPDPKPDDDPTNLPNAPIEGIEGEPTGYVVYFKDGAGIKCESDRPDGQRVDKGTTVSFTITISPFYTGTAKVYAGTKLLTPNENGVYSFVVEEDTTVSFEGISLKESSITGEGSSSDPYLISTPVDLLYVAEQVNSGNTYYTTAYYKLQNDLDFLGEELEIIGNGNQEEAIFAGYFNGNGYTISNYRIESDGIQYIGLFGILEADVSDSSGGTVYDLHLKDFTVTVNGTGISTFCGSLVGYGLGGNIFLCSAENGTIEVYSDYNRFAYVGGLVGIMQALDYNSYAYYSSISYCNADVAVNCNSGSTYVAGGLVGYLSASSLMVTASINNSYFTGSVCGAMRSGGIAGYMTTSTSIVNCYSTGSVSAQTFAIDLVNSADFCYTYAGGIAGYAETGCVISECFSTSPLNVKASLGSDYEVTDGILAGKAQPDEYEYDYSIATVYNCIYCSDGTIDFTNGEYLQNKLNWHTADWTFTNGSYPVVNTQTSKEYTFKINMYFGDATEPTVTIEEFDVYMPLSYWYADGTLPSRLVGDAEENDNRVSYGYYFDEAYTLAVPESFIPTHDMNIYAAASDVKDVAGEYVIISGNGETLYSLTLKNDGTFTYSDAGDTSSSTYRYDGSRILFEEARFARYCDGLSLGKYQLYTFCATLDNGTLTIVGGVYEGNSNEIVYYTEQAPLIAVSADTVLIGSYYGNSGLYTFLSDGTGIVQTENGIKYLTYIRNGSSIKITLNEETITGTVSTDKLTLANETLSAKDIYAGGWTVDSQANKLYTFDGFGNWTYQYYCYRITNGVANRELLEAYSGTYTIDNNGKLMLSGDLSGEASLDNNGVLCVKVNGETVIYHREGSYSGTWVYKNLGISLKLNGICSNGIGTAYVEFLHSNGTVEFYDLVYAQDELRFDTICLYIDGELFGYLTYSPARNTLVSEMYVGTQNTFMSNVSLQRLDEYDGEWIANSDTLPSISFDGFGCYNGTLTVNGKTVPYSLDNSTLSGSFVWQNKVYAIEYRESDGTLLLTQNGIETVYQRKDAYSDIVLTDANGASVITFDGRGELSCGGTMTVKNASKTTEYTYFLENDRLRIEQNGKEIGSLSVNATTREYELSLSKQTTALRIKTRYTGFWGMFGSAEGLTIGTMDVDGKLNGFVKETDVIFELQADGTLAFEFEGTTFYIIPVGEIDLVITPYRDWYLYDTEVICSHVDDLFGTWSSSTTGAYRFDGISGSTLTSGSAETGTIKNGVFTGNEDYYYYSYIDGRYILWTVNATTGQSEIYRINFCDPSTRRAFVNADGTRAFTVEKGDNLYNLTAYDEDSEISYTFDGFGSVTDSEGNTYSYKLTTDIDFANGIASVTLTGEDGSSSHGTVDFSGSYIIITFR